VCCSEWRESLEELPAQCCTGQPSEEPSVSRFVGVELLTATTVTLRTFETMGCMYTELTRHVIPFDRILFGSTIESLGELAVRGQMMVVVLCLRRLRELIRPTTWHARGVDPARKILRNYFGTTDDLIRYVEIELQRITSIYLPLRSTNRSE